jgi:hypothetical protein
VDRRAELNAKFEAITPNVYFQPPRNVDMSYPAIVYRRDPMDTRHADNMPYVITRQYEVTLITENPDSSLVDQLAAFPTARHDRFFVADNLNHDAFSIYY